MCVSKVDVRMNECMYIHIYTHCSKLGAHKRIFPDHVGNMHTYTHT